MNAFDILLLSVIVGTAYTGPMLLRRLPPGRRSYAFMILADLALALIAFASREEEGVPSQLFGVIAIGAAVCLLIIPPILRDLARRALAGERFRLAKLLVELRELLQPGMGGRQEGELIATILAVRRGEVEQAIEKLREQRSATTDTLRRRQVDERIVSTLLYARRWADAVTAYEGGFDGDFSTTSPQLMVEMVRAYCEVEDLESAAALMTRLENSPLVEEPLLVALVHRARLVFLAFVGRTSAVESIVQGPLAAMPDSARHYWSGIARLNAGDRSGAKSSLSRAAKLSPRDSRAREVAERSLERLSDAANLGPRVVSAGVASLADRLTTAVSDARRQPSARGLPRDRRPIVTLALIAVNLAVALGMSLLFPGSADVGGLVRAGANVKEAVFAGELWRLPTSMFLHVGLLHLLLNMYGLYVLGRLVEPMYGSVRFFSVYVVAGLVGAGASAFLGGSATSVGASGAVFGLLGAAIAELSLRRHAYAEDWRRRLLGNLLFLTAANVAVGFMIPMIDQAAHLGGLVGGGLVSAMLSPKARGGEGALVRTSSAVLAIVCAAALVYGAVGISTTTYADTLAGYPRVTRSIGGLKIDVPEPWQPVPEFPGLQDSSLPFLFYMVRLPADATPAEVIAARVQDELQGGAKSLGFDRVAEAEASAVALPEEWQSRELIATAEAEGLGGTQRYRAVVFCRQRGGELWFGIAYLPASLTDALGPEIARVVTSASAEGPLPEPSRADEAVAP